MLLGIALAIAVACSVVVVARSRQNASGSILERKIATLLAEPSTRRLLAPLALQAANASGAEPHRRALRQAYFSKASFEEYYRKRLIEMGTAPDPTEAKIRLLVDDSIAAREMERDLGPLTTDGIMRAFLGSGEEVSGHLWMVFRFAALQEKGIDSLRR